MYVKGLKKVLNVTSTLTHVQAVVQTAGLVLSA